METSHKFLPKESFSEAALTAFAEGIRDGTVTPDYKSDEIPTGDDAMDGEVSDNSSTFQLFYFVLETVLLDCKSDEIPTGDNAKDGEVSNLSITIGIISVATAAVGSITRMALRPAMTPRMARSVPSSVTDKFHV